MGGGLMRMSKDGTTIECTDTDIASCMLWESAHIKEFLEIITSLMEAIHFAEANPDQAYRPVVLQMRHMPAIKNLIAKSLVGSHVLIKDSMQMKRHFCYADSFHGKTVTTIGTGDKLEMAPAMFPCN